MTKTINIMGAIGFIGLATMVVDYMADTMVWNAISMGDFALAGYRLMHIFM